MHSSLRTSSRPARFTPRRSHRPPSARLLVRDASSPHRTSERFSGEVGLVTFVEVHAREDGGLRVYRKAAWLDGSRPPAADEWTVADADAVARVLGPGPQTLRVLRALHAAGVA
jgi:hypothetical protein